MGGRNYAPRTSLGILGGMQSSEIIWRASYPIFGIGRPYYVWCLVVEGFTCGAHSYIARLMHVPQLPGEGDAKGIRLPFQNGKSRATCRGS